MHLFPLPMKGRIIYRVTGRFFPGIHYCIREKITGDPVEISSGFLPGRLISLSTHMQDSSHKTYLCSDRAP